MTKSTSRRLIFAGLTLMATAVAIGLWAGPADAGNYARRGEPCATPGEKRPNRSGVWYVCKQRKGDECPVWHALHPKPGPWPSRSHYDCPRCSPSLGPSTTPASPSSAPASSGTATTSQSATPAPTGTPNSPGGEDDNLHRQTLPVTGRGTAAVAIVGMLLILLGATAIAVTKPWRREDVDD